MVDEHGYPVYNGDAGLLRCLSSQLMTGYLVDPAATAKMIHDGWFWTGDIACWDEWGRIMLLGRNDDFLKLRNGALFNPNEMETCVGMIAGVDDVAVTVDPSTGRIVAFIVSERHADVIHGELFGWVLGSLDAYQFPEIWAMVDVMP